MRAHETIAAAAARLADRKWGVVFETLIPNLQHKIARILKLARSRDACLRAQHP